MNIVFNFFDEGIEKYFFSLIVDLTSAHLHSLFTASELVKAEKWSQLNCIKGSLILEKISLLLKSQKRRCQITPLTILNL